MELDIYVVDAFTDTQFKGNSALARVVRTRANAKHCSGKQPL